MAEEPEKYTINGVEYSADDVSGLVDLGNKYKEIEEKTNTKLDSIWPEYTRTTQEKKALEEQLAERSAELEKLQSAKDKLAEAETPEEIQKAKAALRSLGGVDEDYLKQNNYMTREEAEEFWRQKRFEEQQVETLEKEGAKLEAQIDGSDGRTPFNYRAVLAYANAYKKEDLMSAYNEMNERANKAWTERQLAQEEQKKGLTTLRSGGTKEPPKPKVTNSNLADQLSELVENTLAKE